MLFLVAFLPLLESVGAASSFANSTISKPATLSTSTATTSSCLYPVTIEPYFQYYDCNRPGDPQLPNTANPYELFFDYSDPFVSQCSSSWDSSFSSWLATVPIITQTSTFSEALDEPEGYIAYTTVLTTQTYVNFGGDFSYTAAAPCCYNCSLYGGDVQVYAWPTPAPTPAVTKLVDSANNFTLFVLLSKLFKVETLTSPVLRLRFMSFSTLSMRRIFVDMLGRTFRSPPLPSIPANYQLL